MATQTKEKRPTQVITGLVRFSYAEVFQPTAMDEGGEKKYKCALLIPKSDKETIKKIEAAIAAAAEEGKNSKFGGKDPKKFTNFKWPLRDGDVEKEDEVYAGNFFVNTSAKTKPGIVDRAMNEITDPADFYSGCYGRASINFYAFNTKGNVGVACGLNNLQKLKDGEELSGRTRAVDDFSEEFAGDLGEEDDLL